MYVPLMQALLLTIDDIRAAAERVRPHVLNTPVLVRDIGSATLFCKAESLQPTGAFKLRGAFNALLQRLVAGVARAIDAIVAVRCCVGLAVEDSIAGLDTVAKQPIVAQGVDDGVDHRVVQLIAAVGRTTDAVVGAWWRAGEATGGRATGLQAIAELAVVA